MDLLAAVGTAFGAAAVDTMIDRGIWASAQRCLKVYSDDATIHVAMRSDELMQRGDLDGAAVWRQIITAIKELQNMEPGGAVH